MPTNTGPPMTALRRMQLNHFLGAGITDPAAAAAS
jgi:hypothetical protein